MKLKNWSIITDINTKPNYVAPEMMHYHFYYLQGNVYDNPKFYDGRNVITSRIMKINDKGDYKEAITKSGSVYELHKEDVAPVCEKQYPSYYERLKME